MKVSFNDFKSYYKPHEDEYAAAFKRTLHSGWYILGKEVELFESEFAEYIGVDHCIGVANGLEALQIVLLAYGIGPGDEVITTPVSAFATTLAIHAVGATPIFVDVTASGLIDMSMIEKAISPKTKAVLPVHLFGNALNLNSLKKLCKKNNIILIEDAAQAQGSTKNGQRAGSIGDAGCFSFYPTKNLGALGDGGAIVTNDPTLAASCKSLRDYGQSKKYHHTQFGLNSRLDELQASLLRIRLKYLDKDNAKRVKIADLYKSELADLDSVEILSPSTGGNAHLFVIKVLNRDLLKDFLSSKGIESAIHYPLAIPDQPVYKGKYTSARLPNARQVCSQVLSLPCHPTLTKKEVLYVCEAIKEYMHV